MTPIRNLAPLLSLLLLCAGPAVAVAETAPRGVSGPFETPVPPNRMESWRDFDIRDGLIHSRVFALAAARDGRVYAGTEAGLAYFDGNRWQELPIPTAAGGVVPEVHALLAVDDGSVWIGTDSVGLLRANGDGVVDWGGAHGYAARTIHALLPAGAGALWVADGERVTWCDADACTPIAASEGLQFRVLADGCGSDRGRVLWAGSSDRGLYRIALPTTPDRRAIAGAAVTPVLDQAAGLPGAGVTALACFGGDGDADLWIGTLGGLARRRADTLVRYDRDNGIDTSAVTALAASQDADGALLYAGLQRGGLLRIRDDGHWQRSSRAQGLPDDWIYSILVSGTVEAPRLWLGSKSSGVLRREPWRYLAIGPGDGLPQRSVLGVGGLVEAGEESVWIGTSGGSVRLRHGDIEPLFPPPWEHAAVSGAARAAGRQYFATDLGLIEVDGPGRRLVSGRALGLPGNGLINVAAIDDGAGDGEVLWFGSRRGGGRFIDGRARPFPGDPPAGVREGVLRVFGTIAGAGTGERVFVAGDRGLFFFGANGWTTLAASCLPHPEIYDARLRRTDGHLDLWLATRAGVLRVRLDQGHDCRLLGAAEIGNPLTYQLVFDRSDRLFLFGYRGATRLQFADGPGGDLRRFDLERDDLDDGLPALEFNRAAWLDPLGQVWAGTVNGVAVLDPEQPPSAASTAALVVTVSGSDGRRLAPGARLPSAAADLDVAFQLRDYSREHRHRYRSQVLGLDAQPGEWAATSTRHLERLPAGDYRLRVWARDAAGREYAAPDFDFAVAAAWWRSPGVVALSGLGVLAAGVALGRLRARWHAARAASLEREVAARTHELAEANARLEQASLTDALTGLANRRWFGRRLAGELTAAAELIASGRAPSPRVVALLDLDWFKTINDRHGHGAGDRVLVVVAERLLAAVGERGSAVRWGGEEFLLVIECADAAAADRAVADVLQRLRGEPIDLGREHLTVTGSIGYALWPWDRGTDRSVDLDELLSLIDAALYRAKGDGRDCAYGAIADPAAAVWDDHPEFRVRWRRLPAP